jgi:hypothetical protein
VSTRRLNIDMGTFGMSDSGPEVRKVAEAGHKALRTRAIAAEKSGQGFSSQATQRTGILWPAGSRWAARVTQENSPKRAGVVLALGHYSQVGLSLLEGDFQLPAQHGPFNGLSWSDGKLGAPKCLWLKFTQGVGYQ